MFVKDNPYYKAFYEYGNKNAMVEVTQDLVSYLNYRAYPYIDEDTYKFKWLVPADSRTLSKVKEYINNES